MVSVGCLPNAVKPGSMTKAMIAKPTHGSAPAFFEALYATIRGRKVNTDCHMRLTNVHEGERVTFGSDQFPTTLSVAMIDMKVMMSEAPSSAPSTGRNESDRNSKNVSSHADLPRAAGSGRGLDFGVGRLAVALHLGQGVDGVVHRLHGAADDDLITFPGLGDGTP